MWWAGEEEGKKGKREKGEEIVVGARTVVQLVVASLMILAVETRAEESFTLRSKKLGKVSFDAKTQTSPAPDGRSICRSAASFRMRQRSTATTNRSSPTPSNSDSAQPSP